MSVSKPAWTVKPTPNVFTSGKLRPVAIVCHIMEGTLADCDDWFAQYVSQVSANFGIGKAGEIHCYVDPDGPNAPWANGVIDAPDAAFLALSKQMGGANPNLWSLSLEHEGQPGDALFAAQFDASAHLAAWLCEHFGIPADDAHLLGHYEIDSINRAECPGWNSNTWLDWEKAVRAYLTPAPVPAPQPPVPPTPPTPPAPAGPDVPSARGRAQQIKALAQQLATAAEALVEDLNG